MEADTRYYYQIQPDGETISFKTPPTSASVAGSSVNFAFFGDLGLINGDSSRKYLDELVDGGEIDLIFHGGDVGYADDSFLHLGCIFRFCYEEKWNQFMDAMSSFTSRIPWMTTPGNHEADCHSPACLLSRHKRDKLSNFTAYNSRFRMPSEESGGVMNMWHSFNYGPVHVVAMDLETGFPGAAEEKRYVLKCGGFGDQVAWLKEDLKAARANPDITWIVAGGHHPMYNGGRVDKKMQTAIEPLLHEYHVDVLFTGHVHSYERDWPTYNGMVVRSYDKPGFTTHVMIGGPGNDEMVAGLRRGLEEDVLEEIEQEIIDPSRESTHAWTDSLVRGNADMIAVEDFTHYGIGVVAANRTHLSVEYVQTTDGVVADSFVLTK